MKEYKIDENQILKKNVAAIHICNVPLIQRKLHNVLMYLAVRSKPPGNHLGEYCVSMPVLISLLGYKSKDIAYLKNNLISLSRNNVEWNLFSDNHKEIEWGTASLLASARIRGGNCYFSFPAPLECMLRNPELYAKIDLQIQRKFSSKYALALYENVIRFVNLGCTRWVKLELLKKILGIEEEEPNFEFKYLNRLLKKAIDAVNEESDLLVEVEYRREARRINAVRFLVRFKANGDTPIADPELVTEMMNNDKSTGTQRNSLQKLPDHDPNSINHLQDVIVTKVVGQATNNSDLSDRSLVEHLCHHLGFSRDEAEALLAAYEADFILEHLDKVETKYRKGQIRFVRPYLMSTLEKADLARKAGVEEERRAKEVEQHKQKEAVKLAAESEENRKRLEKEYLAYRAKKLESLMQSLDAELIEELDQNFVESITGTPHHNLFRRRGFESKIISMLYDNFLTQQLVEDYPELSREYYSLTLGTKAAGPEAEEKTASSS